MKEENMNESIQPVTMQMNVPEQVQPTIEQTQSNNILENNTISTSSASESPNFFI